jgi:hypothetical protein
MKASELRQIIREEVQRILKEEDSKQQYVIWMDFQESPELGKKEMWRGPKHKAETVGSNLYRRYWDGAAFNMGLVTAEDWKRLDKKSQFS